MENIYTSVRPFYFVTKALGLFPMTFEGPPDKGIFYVKWHDVIVCLFALGMPFVFIMLIIFLEDGPASSSAMLSDAWKIHFVFSLILIFIQLIIQIASHKSIVKFLDAISIIDKKVSMILTFFFHFQSLLIPDCRQKLWNFM